MLFISILGVAGTFAFLVPAAVEADQWPVSITFRANKESASRGVENGLVGSRSGRLLWWNLPSVTLRIPDSNSSQRGNLRTIESSLHERDSVQPSSLFGSLGPLFDSRTDEHADVKPLLDDGGGTILPVRTLSIPNPLVLLGNPTKWGGRFRSAYGTNFGRRRLLSGNLIIDSGLPFGFDTEFNRRTDPRPILADRRFWNGDFNVIYHLKQIQYISFRIGVGANWLYDGSRTDVGFNTTYGFDIRLKKPFYVTTTIDWGWLGSKRMLHWHISGGVEFGWIELFIGYDFFEVGNTERKNVIIGAGIWF